MRTASSFTHVEKRGDEFRWQCLFHLFLIQLPSISWSHSLHRHTATRNHNHGARVFKQKESYSACVTYSYSNQSRKQVLDFCRRVRHRRPQQLRRICDVLLTFEICHRLYVHIFKEMRSDTTEVKIVEGYPSQNSLELLMLAASNSSTQRPHASLRYNNTRTNTQANICTHTCNACVHSRSHDRTQILLPFLCSAFYYENRQSCS